MRAPRLMMVLLLVACFGLAAGLDPYFVGWNRGARRAAGILEVLLGDGRRLFANHFFVKADVYLHSGYYPSIFDQAAQRQSPRVEDAEHADVLGAHAGQTEESDEHVHGAACAHVLGSPRDWIDGFGRAFFPSEHTHLDKPGEASEILPWLKLSAELDPGRVETYVVAAYWLRTHLGQAEAAEQFLRQGWRANPDSYEILFELGRVAYENRKDPARARNLWELALRKWRAQGTAKPEAGKAESDRLFIAQLTGQLAKLEEAGGNLAKAIEYLELLKAVSPFPDQVQKRIDELRRPSP